jgi:carboxypeptidase Ss1
MDVLGEARRIEPEILKNRRALHQHPELAYHEVETAKMVAEKLESYGIVVKRGLGGTGVLGTLKGGKPGRVVALRADMDGLPVQEQSDVEFRSKADGVMHACGHDTHVAMLLGAARILAENRSELRGTVKFLFQPAEEHGGRGGAMPMIEEGVMKNPTVDYVFGLHISSTRKSGEIGVREGAMMAAPDTFKVKIVGRGGHGSAPHQTIDPVYVAAHVILALQGVSSRMINPVRPFVISVGSVHSGTKENIIPDVAMLEGTIRTMDEGTRKLAKKKVEQVAKGVCKTFGATAVVEFEADAYPVTINDPKSTQKAARVLKRIPGIKIVNNEPVLGGEDFSRFLQKAPGTFYFLGTGNPAKGCVHPNHSSRFKVDEDVLKLGAASLALLAFEFGNPKGPS